MNIISDEACSAQESDSVTVSNPTNPTECITDSSSYEGRISEEMLCAGAPGKDSCQVPGLKLLHQISTRPTRYKLHISQISTRPTHQLHQISTRSIFSGRQWWTVHCEERGNEPTRSCRSCQLGRWLCCGKLCPVGSIWPFSIVNLTKKKKTNN